MPRVAFDTLNDELRRVLEKKGFRKNRAQQCARLFAETTRDGVYSHGLNRFPRFIAYIEEGVVDIETEPQRIDQFGPLEQWNGQKGPGNLNAYRCMERAIELGRTHGIGCVALRNTNHWMRGGTYGWQAADAGMVGVCWSNTMQNMPPWGSRESRVGNNPFIIAVPRPEGHVVLDMAMSQFSYGALEEYERKDQTLPIYGGYNEDNELTLDPGAILKSGRPLPAGLWKGSGLSIMLDMVGALLSHGKATHEISTKLMEETDLTQIFLTFDLDRLYPNTEAEQVVNGIVDHLHASTPAGDADAVCYPGERTLKKRRENMERGIPVDEDVWREVQNM